MAKLDKAGISSKLGFRNSLKSTGQSKYALEDKEEVSTLITLLCPHKQIVIISLK